jgi:hypothetical protein
MLEESIQIVVTLQHSLLHWDCFISLACLWDIPTLQQNFRSGPATIYPDEDGEPETLKENPGIRNSGEEMKLNRKTKPRYLGPYEVVRRTTGGSYVLQELDGTMLIEGAAAFRLLPYVSCHDKNLLKEIAKDISDDREESGSEEDWFTDSEGSDYEGSDDDEYMPL